MCVRVPLVVRPNCTLGVWSGGRESAKRAHELGADGGGGWGWSVARRRHHRPPYDSPSGAAYTLSSSYITVLTFLNSSRHRRSGRAVIPVAFRRLLSGWFRGQTHTYTHTHCTALRVRIIAPRRRSPVCLAQQSPTVSDFGRADRSGASPPTRERESFLVSSQDIEL